MDIVQIVGYKNSGKTTTVSELIYYFSKRGYRVASIKHHGHGGVPDGITETDSEKHKQAGAVLSGVEGEGLLQLSKESWSIEEILTLYSYMDLDKVFIEGFKTSSYPKIVLVRNMEDLSLLDKVENVIAIISHISLVGLTYQTPIFKNGEISKLCNWLEKQNN